MKSINTFRDSDSGDGSTGREEFRASRLAQTGAVVAVAATYFYFLIFAQFGLLKALQAALGEDSVWMPRIMGVMVLAGIGGCAAAAFNYTERRARGMLLGSYLVCGVAAAHSLWAAGKWAYALIALLTGVGVGAATVTLASSLRRVTGGERLGSILGAGTGLAYALANLPTAQNASPAGQAVFALGAACVAILAVQAFEWRAPAHKPSGPDYQPAGITVWILVFLALVWLDSATFFILQHDAVEWAASWGSRGRQFINALVHGITALLAGYALDRRWMGRAILTGAAMLLVASYLAGVSGDEPGRGALLYIGGVSIYSTVLVFYPARCGRPWVAALVYSVAGWIGSGLGISMAQHLHHVPSWLMLPAAVLIGGAMLARGILRRRERRAPRDWNPLA